MNLFRLQLFILGLVLLLNSCMSGSPEADYSLIPVKMGDRWGYIDQSGVIVINPQFSSASFFSDDMAVVSIDGKYGYINKKGEYEIAPSYKDATIFNDGIAWVVKEGGAPTAINKKGKELFSCKDAQMAYCFQEGIAVFTTANPEVDYPLYGFLDDEGKIIIGANFNTAGLFSDGLAAVKNREGKCGYIDKAGKMVIGYQFDRGAEFYNGKAVVEINDLYGVIDKKGKLIINPQFDFMQSDGDLFLVRMKDQFGWCDETGKLVINPQFKMAGPFLNNSLAPVCIGDQWGYINKKGKIVINPQFSSVYVFMGDIAPVTIGSGDDHKLGFINKEGTYVVNPQFSSGYISRYHFVSSDYFNVEAIVATLKSILSNNKVDGIDFKTKLSEIMTKYSLDESHFSYYSSTHVLKEFSSSPDATISLQMTGNLYNQVSDGWWGYKNILKEGATADKFSCYVALKEKGEDKGMMLYDELKKGFGLNDKGECRLGKLYLSVTYTSNGVLLEITPGYTTKDGGNVASNETDSEQQLSVFEGKINDKYKITMTLSLGGNTVTGSYKYASRNLDIPLDGELTSDEDLTLKETVDGKKTGTFTGKLVNGEFSGTWINADGTKTMPFFVTKIR